MKKISVVIMAVMMLLTVMQADIITLASGQIQVNDDIVLNGGFENLGEDWRFFEWDDGSTTSVISAEDEPGNVHSGNYAVKITTTGVDRAFIVQQYKYDWMSGCEYELSFWYKGTAGNHDFEVVIEEWGGGKVVGNYYSGKLDSAAEWTKVTGTFRAVDGIDDFRIVPQANAAGTEIYIDDVSLVVTAGPEQPFTVEFDQAFYNEDYDYATVKMNLHNFYPINGYTVDVAVKRGLKTYVQAENIEIESSDFEYKIDITGLSKKTEYTATLSFKDGAGTVVQTVTQRFCRIDRPTFMTKDGMYMLDGKPFEPVYAYHFDLNDAEDALEAGVNVIQWAPTDGTNEEQTMRELDQIDSLGLKAAVVCYWGMMPAGHPNNSARIQTFIERIKDHPAVFCYMVMDEIFWNYDDDEEAEEHLYASYKTIRFTDDKHPVYLCENLEEMFPVSVKYVDILGIDPYPGNGKWDTHVADITKKAVEATKGEKPVYCLVQAFSWYNGTPTPQMLRTQLYQAMAAGAKAVGYYTWVPDDPSRDQDLNEGRYWETMLNFHQEDQPYLYSYFGRNEYERYNKYHGDNMWYESWIDGNSLYIAVLNRGTEESTEGIISLVGESFNAFDGEYTVSVVNGGQPISLTKSADSFTIEMPRFHSAIYKIDVTGESESGGDEINVKLLSGGEEISDIAELGAVVTAYAYNTEKGDKIYLALYTGEADEPYLYKVAAVTGTGINAVSCAINDIPENITAVKTFVWNKNAGSKTVKAL